MRLILYAVTLFLLQFCSHHETRRVKEIKIKKYVFDFPSSFRVIKQKTFNSYIGLISNDTISIEFHFSDHVRPPVQSLSDFFEDEAWKSDVLMHIAPQRKIVNFFDVVFFTPRRATEKDSSIGKGCDYIVKCKYDSLEFEAPIYLPEKIKAVKVLIDTIYNQHRETYISENPENGITGLFIKKISKNQEYEALSLSATKLTKSQQDSLIKIFSTIRLVPDE